MSELQAAVDRLRRLKGDIASAGYCYMASIYPNGGYLEDVQMLADTYLAEHPKDDVNPVTVQWLLASGFEPEDHPAKWTIKREDALPIGLWIVDDGWKAMLIHHENAATCLVRQQNTRGDVRRLCAALGIELKSA